MNNLIGFDDRDGYIWYNGDFVPWRQARLHILSHGLHYASSAFEGERCYNGRVFKLAEHGQRLKLSCQTIGIDLPYEIEFLDRAVMSTLEKNNIVNGYVRRIVWRGSEMMAISAQHNQIHVAIACWEWPSYFDPDLKRRGIKLDISQWSRPSPHTAPVHAKVAGLYMICTLSKHEAERKGFNDSLMLDYRGHVAEATGANIFFVKEGCLHTPLADCFLDGITRRSVIELAKKRGIDVIERTILPEELGDFEECFLTGTAAEVTPVGCIDVHQYTPGALTHMLMDDYVNWVEGI